MRGRDRESHLDGQTRIYPNSNIFVYLHGNRCGLALAAASGFLVPIRVLGTIGGQ